MNDTDGTIGMISLESNISGAGGTVGILFDFGCSAAGSNDAMRFIGSNAGSGSNYAFYFQDEFADTTKTSVSGFDGVIPIRVGGAVRYIPFYDTAS